MAFDPKPITVEYVSPEEYDGSQDPQPFVVVGEAPGGEAPVTSVNGATGAVVLEATDVGAAATTHTHTAAQVASGTLADARIPALAIAKITGLQAIIDDYETRIAALESAGA